MFSQFSPLAMEKKCLEALGQKDWKDHMLSLEHCRMPGGCRALTCWFPPMRKVKQDADLVYLCSLYIYIFIYLVKLWEIVKMDLGSFLLPGNAKAIIWMMKLPNQRNRSMHPWLRIKILARRKPGLKTCASSSPHWKGRGRDCSCFALFRMFNYPPAKVDSRQAEYPNDLRLGFQK